MILWKMIRNAVRTAMFLLTLAVLGVRLVPLFLGASGGAGAALQPPGMVHQPPGMGDGPQSPMGQSQEDLIRMLMAMRQQLGQPGAASPLPATGAAETRPASRLPQIQTSASDGFRAPPRQKVIRVGE